MQFYPLPIESPRNLAEVTYCWPPLLAERELTPQVPAHPERRQLREQRRRRAGRPNRGRVCHSVLVFT